jgi:hypothetical protein
MVKFARNAIAAFALATGAALAETPRYGLRDLAFLEGAWRGEADGMQFSEFWTENGAGAMAGVFKLARGEAYSVVEFMLIAQEKSGPVLRFKHFRKDYSTWEADGPPQTLRLLRAGKGFAEFAPLDPASKILKLDYRLAKGTLTASVTLRADDNPPKMETFSFVYSRD